MALSKQTIFDAITIRSTGHIEIRMATVVTDDGEEMGRKFHRRLITPGDDVTGEPQKIQQLTQLFWTQAMITAAQAARNL